MTEIEFIMSSKRNFILYTLACLLSAISLPLIMIPFL